MLPIQISTDGIVKLLRELRPQKVQDGPDCITATILKTCVEKIIAPLLQQIFQTSLDTGEPQFPSLILLPGRIATDTLIPRTVAEWNRHPLL